MSQTFATCPCSYDFLQQGIGKFEEIQVQTFSCSFNFAEIFSFRRNSSAEPDACEVYWNVGFCVNSVKCWGCRKNVATVRYGNAKLTLLCWPSVALNLPKFSHFISIARVLPVCHTISTYFTSLRFQRTNAEVSVTAEHIQAANWSTTSSISGVLLIIITSS